MSAQGNSGYVTELDVRIWLRDNDPAANTLLDDYEFSPEELRTAMTLTVDYWNDQPPFISTMDITTFPFRSKLVLGTAANLLFMAAHRYRRNSLRYQTGGGVVSDQEKFAEYDAAGAKLWDEYKQWVQDSKRAYNVESGWELIS